LVMPFVLSFSGRQHECGECKCRSSRWLADGQDSQRGQSWFESECSSLPSQNMGRVVSSDEIRHATGTSEWARRLRELRDEFGYAILTCADETRAKSRGISKASLFKHPIIERLLLQIQRVRLLERVPVWQTRVSATSRLCQLLCPPNRQMGTGAHSQPHARITTKLFCFSGNVENRRVVLTIPPALGAGGLRFKSGRPDHFSKLCLRPLNHLEIIRTRSEKMEVFQTAASAPNCCDRKRQREARPRSRSNGSKTAAVPN